VGVTGGRLASKKTRIAVGAGVAVVLAAVVGANVVRERGKRVAVQTQKVARKDLVSVVSASGEVRPKRYVNVSANVSGRITFLLVKEGDSVRKGQVLARIDSTRFEAGERQSAAALEAARADLARAQADVDAARLAFERAKRMHADKLISDQVFEQAEAELKMKTAQVQSQRERIAQQAAALETNRDDLAKTTVVAPMDGIVTALLKEEGEMVIGAQSFSPTVIMTVADLSVMETEVMVDETDIRSLSLGQEAEVRVDALEGVKIKGQVTEIGSSAIVRATGAATQTTTTSTANQAKDFKVTVTLLDPPATLRPGLNATADIKTAARKNVLTVPIQAVVVRELNKEGKVVDPEALQAAGPQAEEPVRAKGEEKDGVFVVQKDKAVFKPVKTGIVGETEVEVLSGLGDGEEIVSGSYRTLRTLKDQAKIKPEVKKERS
jgi:HlyD family secretion protein